MKIKIKDIAKKANVSLATVSLALNNKPGVSEKTRKRILEIAEEMNNNSVSKLNQVKNGTILFSKIVKHGHVLNRDHDVFIASYLDGMELEARKNGFKLEVNTFKTDNIANVVQTYRNPTFNGLIIMGTELDEGDFKYFNDIEIPTVFVDTFYLYLPFNFVDKNNRESSYRIIKYFIENGHKEIGFIKSPVKVRNFDLREEGYFKALSHYGIEPNDDYIYSVGSTFDGAYKDMKSLLDRGVKLPSALYASSDIIAYGCIKAFKEKNIKIPEDVSIIGYDDLPLSSLMSPPLTTIMVSKEQIGRMSMKLMIELLNDVEPPPPYKIKIGGSLIERQTVKSIN